MCVVNIYVSVYCSSSERTWLIAKHIYDTLSCETLTIDTLVTWEWLAYQLSVLVLRAECINEKVHLAHNIYSGLNQSSYIHSIMVRDELVHSEFLNFYIQGIVTQFLTAQELESLGLMAQTYLQLNS